jgi:hypothetical protein
MSKSNQDTINKWNIIINTLAPNFDTRVTAVRDGRVYFTSKDVESLISRLDDAVSLKSEVLHALKIGTETLSEPRESFRPASCSQSLVKELVSLDGVGILSRLLNKELLKISWIALLSLDPNEYVIDEQTYSVKETQDSAKRKIVSSSTTSSGPTDLFCDYNKGVMTATVVCATDSDARSYLEVLKKIKSILGRNIEELTDALYHNTAQEVVVLGKKLVIPNDDKTFTFSLLKDDECAVQLKFRYGELIDQL